MIWQTRFTLTQNDLSENQHSATQWLCSTQFDHVTYARKEKPWFNLLIQGRWSWVKTSHTVYCCESTHAWYIMPKVVTQVYMHDCKILKLFWTCGNGQKTTKCDQFFHPISNFFNFCNIFLLPYLNQWCSVGLVDRAFAEVLWPKFVYMSVPLDWKINKGVLGTNVSTTSWLYWSKVSWTTWIEPTVVLNNQPSSPLCSTCTTFTMPNTLPVGLFQYYNGCNAWDSPMSDYGYVLLTHKHIGTQTVGFCFR